MMLKFKVGHILKMINTKQPLVSVIIPVYNTERFVAETIQSVLNQTYPHIEIICVNDGSTDGSLEVLSSFGSKIKIISQKNQGVAQARNTGVKVAHGTIIGLLDADDLWPTNHVALLLPHLMGTTVNLVRGQTRVLYMPGASKLPKEKDGHVTIPCLVGSALYRREVFDTVGLFDPAIGGQGEDFDWYIRFLARYGREQVINEVVLEYRRHANNITNERKNIARGMFDALRKKLADSK